MGLSAQAPAYDIKFTIEGYSGDILTIANNLLDKQYVVDTVRRGADGAFRFTDTAELKKGIYLAVLAPNNNYFQFLVGNEDPFFSLKSNVTALSKVTPIGSAENEGFYQYLSFLDEQKAKDDPLREAAASASPEEKAEIDDQRNAIDAAVKAYQQNLIDNNGESFVSAIVRANQPVNPPPFPELDDEARRLKQWRYLQKHYFDNIDLKDDRLLRTPFLFERIDYFVHKLQVQHPDTIGAAIDEVLAKMNPEGEAFKYYLVHYLNEAAGSTIVGMDAVYVHLIDEYYAKGKAPWTEADQLDKFKDNADRLRPLLIGRPAPDITVQDREGNPVVLSEIDSEYTVLYFWRYDCGHCKESTPDMKAFHDKWKDRGVTLLALCAKTAKEVAPCWEYIDENELGDWLHTVDPYMRSRYGKLYDVQQTPAIYVLDKDKTIISKRIGADQLDGLLESITERKRLNLDGEKDSEKR